MKIGRALGYDVYVARNDRHRSFEGQSFAMLTVPELPRKGWLAEIKAEVRDTVSLIDVIWLKKDTSEIVSAFEVEKSTSIYSGILRLEDLARSIPVENCACHFYLVAPSSRAKEVVAQLTRPAFRSTIADNSFAFITFDDLCTHCDALCRFGEDYQVLRKVVFNSGSAAKPERQV